MWEAKWGGKDEDCVAACRRISGELGVKAPDKPLYRLKASEKSANNREWRDALSRGLKYPDKVVKVDQGEYLKVYSGRYERKGRKPTARLYPLLPGMLIYTAENLAWEDRSTRKYKWFDRHMMMYAGDGEVYENFRPPPRPEDTPDPHDTAYDTGPRDLLADTGGAYESGTSFVVGLSIYDPFFELRPWWQRGLLTLYQHK
jgi:hypothetical protein